MANIKKDRKNKEFIKTDEMAKQPGYGFLGDFRYDPRLTDGAKILLSEIILLSNTKGYCYMSNGKLAKLFNKSIRTIQSYIKELVECGYLLSEIIRNDKKEVEERRLTPTKSATKTLPKKEENKESKITNVEVNDGALKQLFADLFGKEPKTEQAAAINKMENKFGFEVVEKSMVKVSNNLKHMSGFGKYLEKTCNVVANEIAKDKEREDLLNSYNNVYGSKPVPSDFYYDWMSEDGTEEVAASEVPTNEELTENNDKNGILTDNEGLKNKLLELSSNALKCAGKPEFEAIMFRISEIKNKLYHAV